MSLNENAEKNKVIEKIKKWLNEEGYTVNVRSTSDSYYHATIVKQKALTVDIDITKDSVDKIHVETVFGSQRNEKPSYTSEDAHKAATHDIALIRTLIPLNVEHSVDATMEGMEIRMWKTIYFDGLSKHVLFETIGDVRAAYRALDLMHKQKLSSSDSSSS
jgi:hypothetical protein